MCCVWNLERGWYRIVFIFICIVIKKYVFVMYGVFRSDMRWYMMKIVFGINSGFVNYIMSYFWMLRDEGYKFYIIDYKVCEVF